MLNINKEFYYIDLLFKPGGKPPEPPVHGVAEFGDN